MISRLNPLIETLISYLNKMIINLSFSGIFHVLSKKWLYISHPRTRFDGEFEHEVMEYLCQ